MKRLITLYSIAAVAALVLIGSPQASHAARFCHTSQQEMMPCTPGLSPAVWCQHGSTRQICECKPSPDGIGHRYKCRPPVRGEKEKAQTRPLSAETLMNDLANF